MAVPKKRSSVSRKGKRRAGQHHRLNGQTVISDPTSGEFALRHKISPSGYYKGVKIFETKADKQDDEEETTTE